MRQEAAVPEAEAAADHVPVRATAPPDAAAKGEAGSDRVANKPDGSAAAQFAGSAPEKIFIVDVEPRSVLIALSLAFLRLVPY